MWKKQQMTASGSGTATGQAYPFKVDFSERTSQVAARTGAVDSGGLQFVRNHHASVGSGGARFVCCIQTPLGAIPNRLRSGRALDQVAPTRPPVASTHAAFEKGGHHQYAQTGTRAHHGQRSARGWSLGSWGPSPAWPACLSRCTQVSSGYRGRDRRCPAAPRGSLLFSTRRRAVSPKCLATGLTWRWRRLSLCSPNEAPGPVTRRCWRH